jgi:site-specific DNA-cytosine methylase
LQPVNYYNEIDDKAAAWLRELVSQKLIPAGDVDTRSITEVKAHELKGYTQCHFFAGIAGWPLALQLAGWPADRPVWTGSCPCQPFSTAGKGLAQKDERHLWPAFFDLIRQCRPPVVFGEQVASSAVVGLRRTHAGVQQMRDREAVLGFLRRKRASSTGIMQSVQEFADILATEGELQHRPNQQTGYDFGFSGSLQGKESRDTFQLGAVGHLGAYSGGRVRDDRNTFRPDKAEVLELPIPRSDHPGSRVHKGQCQSGDLLSKCDEPQLGSEPDFEGCGVDQDSAPREVERLIAEIGSEVESYTPVWVDGVQDDLEGAGYAFGACVMAASSVQSPHQRQRLYWVANNNNEGPQGHGRPQPKHGQEGWEASQRHIGQSGVRSDGMADPESARRRQHARAIRGATTEGVCEPERQDIGRTEREAGRISDCCAVDGLWSDFQLVHCRDGKTRRVPTEPAFQPLAHGVPARVVRLRGYGNAIVPQCAQAFIEAFLEIE